MNGYDLSKAIRQIEKDEHRSRSPIIAWTANVLSDSVKQCYAAGMDDILQQPYELSNLKEIILKWLPSIFAKAASTQTNLTNTQSNMQNKMTANITPLDDIALDNIATNPTERNEILQDFLQQTEVDISELEKAVASKNRKEISHIAHRIKGASLMIGANPLAETSKALEMLAQQETSDITHATSSLTEAWQTLKEFILGTINNSSDNQAGK